MPHFAAMHNRPIQIYHELLTDVRCKAEEHNRWKLSQTIENKYKRSTLVHKEKRESNEQEMQREIRIVQKKNVYSKRLKKALLTIVNKESVTLLFNRKVNWLTGDAGKAIMVSIHFALSLHLKHVPCSYLLSICNNREQRIFPYDEKTTIALAWWTLS